MSRFFQRLVFVLGTAVFAALGLGFLFGQFGFLGVHAGGDQDGAYRQMSVYAQVLKRIQSDYVTEPNITDVTTGALHGLLESLDADSSYLTAAEYKIYKDRPTTGVGQIGITVSKRGGYLAIVDVTPGSPADHEHLAGGDVIESIGDTSTFEASLAVTRMMLEGKPGTSVTLTVVKPRKADPEKVTVTRALTQVPSLSETQYENSTILYLKPGVISKARVDELGAKIKGSKAKKILLDLRDVSGGEEEDGVRLANFFIQSGTLAQLEGQKFPKQTFAADPAKSLTQAPVVVLVNRGTYGAAELVASAIEDSKRGDVVGERTFGEGSMQKTIELPDGAALLLTIAKYEGPAGKKIQDEAVMPNVRVAPAEDDGDEDTPSKGDPMLDKGLELLKAKG
ncbi:S41 family peptidase [Terracidiphilus gabretensis]|uniref:S41 family peptidase n=1 Tax=Terracidiphilus gabretensis TaxID=1577687 RepID=UPI00071B2E32|nr:S41 family peptidase [Terracidiphilus gabretensis]